MTSGEFKSDIFLFAYTVLVNFTPNKLTVSIKQYTKYINLFTPTLCNDVTFRSGSCVKISPVRNEFLAVETVNTANNTIKNII